MSFSSKIIDWYQANKRNLPWRSTSNAYKIWLSEIIMQQTRIDQGTSYYLRFVKRFPDIFELAKAKEEDVLKLWQGLGYYSRARNLYATAIEIANNHNGKFPENYSELLKLQGIGEYTAAAIASFAFNLPYAVTDGNVARLMARYCAIRTPVNTSKGKKIIQEKATKYMDRAQPALYNQAIMEFGALICKPVSPLCSSCIFNTKCQALKKHLVNDIPSKLGKIKTTDRFFNYLFVKNKNDNIFIKKRTENDIWKGLYDFPMIETKEKISKKKLEDILRSEKYFGNKGIRIQSTSTEYIHILSHQKLHAVFYSFTFSEKFHIDGFNKKYKKVDHDQLKKYPIPRLVEKFLQDINFF